MRDVEMLRRRTHWHLSSWRRLSRRERRRLLARPILLAEQRAWEAAGIKRLNAAFKSAFAGAFVEMALPVAKSWISGFPFQDGPVPGQPLDHSLVIVHHAEQPVWAVAEEEEGGEE